MNSIWSKREGVGDKVCITAEPHRSIEKQRGLFYDKWPALVEDFIDMPKVRKRFSGRGCYEDRTHVRTSSSGSATERVRWLPQLAFSALILRIATPRAE
jgi:hypothetical protein